MVGANPGVVLVPLEVLNRAFVLLGLSVLKT